MKRIISILFLVSGFLVTASAQFNPSKITVGGGLGLQFGDYTLINIAPQVGYNLNKNINVGAGFSYSYFNDKYGTIRYKQSYFGFNLYTNLYPLPFIVFKIQPEANRMWKTVEYKDSNVKERTSKFIPSCIVGGGLRFGPMNIMVNYDLAQNSDSPYGNQIFYSIGYTFGF